MGNVEQRDCFVLLDKTRKGGDVHRYSYTEIQTDEAYQRLLNPAGKALYIIDCLSKIIQYKKQ